MDSNPDVRTEFPNFITFLIELVKRITCTSRGSCVAVCQSQGPCKILPPKTPARAQMDMAIHGHSDDGDNKPEAGTTTFLNEVSTTEVQHVSPTMLDEAYHRTGSSGYVQGLKEFLAKPVVIKKFNFGTTSSRQLATIRLDRTIFEDNPVWADKLYGFMGIRGTWVIRLQVNATPFQQGRMLMVFEPMKQYYETHDRLADLTLATQLPRVELDISAESQAIMTVPYVNLQSHMDFMNNTGAWGDVNVIQYLPFRTGASSDSADCTLWASLEDVELVAPTVPWQGPARPQMSTSLNQKVSGYGFGALTQELASRIDGAYQKGEAIIVKGAESGLPQIELHEDDDDVRAELTSFAKNDSRLFQARLANTSGERLSYLRLYEDGNLEALFGDDPRLFATQKYVSDTIEAETYSKVEPLVIKRSEAGYPPFAIYNDSSDLRALFNLVGGSNRAIEITMNDASSDPLGDYRFYEDGTVETPQGNLASEQFVLDRVPQQSQWVVESFDFADTGYKSVAGVTIHVDDSNRVSYNPKDAAQVKVYSNSGASAPSIERWTVDTDLFGDPDGYVRVELDTTAGTDFRVAVLPFSSALPQMSMRKGRKNPTSAETGASQTGPITNLLQRVTDVATAAAGVPVLTGFAGPTAWASSIAAKVAGAFGWSKPLNTSEISRMNRTRNQYQSNVEGVDNAFSLGLLATAQTRALPGFAGTDIDEMSLEFVKRVPAFVTSFQFSSLSSHATPLFQMPLRPVQMFNCPPVSDNSTGPPGDGDLFSMSPVAFLSYLFKYYRGGFNVKFKMAKTQFHSGRIAVSFLPAYRSAIDNEFVRPSFNDSVFLHRDIIDLREGHEFEFHIPFVSFLPYLEVGESFGLLQCWVVHDLKHPETTSDVVDVAVEVCAAEDFELAVPVGPVFAPTPRATPQMDMGNTTTTLGASKTDPQATIWSEMCVGEKIQSLKQLMHRAVEIDDVEFNEYKKKPFGVFLGSKTDYYSMIASMYAFSRGGIIFRALREDGGSLVWRLRTDQLSANKRRFFPFVTELDNNFASVYVPQYMQVHGRLNHQISDSGSAAGRYQSQVQLELDGTPTNVYRCAAEDTQFGYFLGVPPMRALT